MPRSGRLLLDGAIYHIIQRGHNKTVLFKEQSDLERFKTTIRTYKGKFLFELYHYCLMANHIHLILKIIKKDDLPQLMKGILQTYSFHFRRKYSYSGYLYEGRYKSIHIDRDDYLLECGRYIERNPVRANIVAEPSKYPWSSYNYYANGKIDDIITADPLYETLANTRTERKNIYINYVSEIRPYEKLLDEVLNTII